MDPSCLSVGSHAVNERFDDGVAAHEAASLAINTHDALLEALEWALERAEPEVNEAALPMDQINLIKYQALLKELQC